MENRYLLKKIMEHYDEHENVVNRKKFKNVEYKIDNNEIIINKEKYKLQHIGILIPPESYSISKEKEFTSIGENNIWIWGWSLYETDSIMYDLAKKLLKFAIDINIKNSYIMAFIKQLLVTSRIEIKNNINLSLILAITIYILKHSTIFKHKVYLDKNKTKYMIYYYLLIE